MRFGGMRTNATTRARLVLVAALMGSAVGVVATSPAGAVTPTVSIRMSNTAPDVGQLVTISGTVTPNRAGQVVTLQRYAKATRTWVTYSRVALNRYSQYAYGYRPTTPGNQTWRAVFSTAAQPMAAFVAYRWIYLYNLDTAEGGVGRESVEINGQTFVRSIVDGSNDSSQWNLRRNCSTFKATIGLPDSEPSTRKINLAVYADAVSRVDQVLSFGQSKFVQVSIAGALRLRLDWTTAGDHWAVGAFGNAAIRCSW